MSMARRNLPPPRQPQRGRAPPRGRPAARSAAKASRGRCGERVEPAIGVDQRAVGGRVGQRALVVLSVDFDQRGGERAKRLGADALVVHVGAACVRRRGRGARSVRRQARCPGLPGQHAAAWPGRVEERRSPVLAPGHDARGRRRRARRPPAQAHRGEWIFRTRLAGKNREPGRELEVQLVDQHHVANGEA